MRPSLSVAPKLPFSARSAEKCGKFSKTSTSLKIYSKLKRIFDLLSTTDISYFTVFNCVTALFTKPPDGLPLYRMGSGGHSVGQFPIDIFSFCRERPVTKEPAAL